MRLMRLWIAAMSVAVLACGVAQTARAAAPVIDWDPAYTWEIGATPTNSPLGGEFKMVGTISSFGAPLAFLNPSIPATEYTFYVHGLISGGTIGVGPPTTRLYTTYYTGGQIEIYQDAAPNASFDPNPPNGGVPADFTDGGPPILTGIFTSFVVQSNNFTAFNTGNIEGNFVWTGGTLYGALSSSSSGPCPALLTGGSTWFPAVMIPGYIYRHDGKIDLQCPTPARSSTWGAIKSLYR